MERLTRKSEYAPGRWTYDCCSMELVDKLAEYEDLEEQGKLLKLPCKLGDTVYWVNNWFYDKKWTGYKYHITKSTMVRMACDDTGTWAKLENGESIDFSAFGKTVFLTQEAAEAALKEMEQCK